MSRLEGSALLSTVALLSCLGFLLIGYDNGLMVRTANYSPRMIMYLICLIGRSGQWPGLWRDL
jgi:hypothetical protein